MSYYLSGEKLRGRFGQTLANIGDLNHDGMDELAVGAPYAGPDGRGAVYIYFGSRKGLRPEPSQVCVCPPSPSISSHLISPSLSPPPSLSMSCNRSIPTPLHLLPPHAIVLPPFLLLSIPYYFYPHSPSPCISLSPLPLSISFYLSIPLSLPSSFFLSILHPLPLVSDTKYKPVTATEAFPLHIYTDSYPYHTPLSCCDA